MRFSTAVLLGVLAGGPALAAETAPEAAGMGLGTRTCAEFAKDYAASPQMNEVMYFSWAQGWMSALNGVTIRADGNYRDMGMRLQDQMAQVRQYCNDHPLAYYGTAVAELHKSLPLRRSTANSNGR